MAPPVVGCRQCTVLPLISQQLLLGLQTADNGYMIVMTWMELAAAGGCKADVDWRVTTAAHWTVQHAIRSSQATTEVNVKKTKKNAVPFWAHSWMTLWPRWIFFSCPGGGLQSEAALPPTFSVTQDTHRHHIYDSRLLNVTARTITKPQLHHTWCTIKDWTWRLRTCMRAVVTTDRTSGTTLSLRISLIRRWLRWKRDAAVCFIENPSS